MIQPRTIVKVADNSGAKIGRIFKVLGSSKKRYAKIGELVIFSVQKAEPRKEIKKKAVLFSKIEEGETDLDAFLAPYVESVDLPDELLQKKQVKADLNRILQELSPAYRSVLLLRYVEHMKFREMADVLQEPIDTIKSKHRRALIQLRRMLVEAPKIGGGSYIE